MRLQAIHAIVELIPLEAAPVGAFVLGGYALDGLRYVERPVIGSGTLITSTGLILTNAHVVARGKSPAALIEVRVTDAPDRIARPAYLAKVVRFDAAHDLAAVQVVANLSGEPVAGLALPAVRVGSSLDLVPGDSVSILGYPAIGGRTLTFTAGQVSGFVGRDFQTAGRDFIKTDAKVSSGASGGAALDDDGRLIGIPSSIVFDPSGAPQESQNYLRPIELAEESLGLAALIAGATVDGRTAGPGELIFWVGAVAISIAATETQPGRPEPDGPRQPKR